MKINSIRFKVKSLNLTLLAAVFIIYFSLMYLSLRHAFYRDLDLDLERKTNEIQAALTQYLDILGEDQEALDFAVQRMAMREGEHPEQMSVLGVENRWLRRADELGLRKDYVNISFSPAELRAGAAWNAPGLRSFLSNMGMRSGGEIQFYDVTVNQDKLRMINAEFSSPGGLPYVIKVGTSLRQVMIILRRQLNYSLTIFVISLLFVHRIDRSFAARILKPMVEVTRTARAISHRDLSARVKTAHIDVEMLYLVEAFNDMIARLEDAFKSIKGISSNMAHELRTPLAIIKGEAEVALRTEQTKTDYKNAIRVILEETDQMNKIIEDLLLMTRLKYQREVYSRENIDFIEFWKEVHEQSEILAAGNVQVTISLPAEPLEIIGNKLHLRRLFFNILDNALKFTPAGGTVSICVRKADDEAVISIADTGVGIAATDMPNIFDQYFRGERAATVGREGIGIGLIMAKEIVDFHRGTITVKSTPGEGTVVTVILPLHFENIHVFPAGVD